jgi:hypothetical protein
VSPFSGVADWVPRSDDIDAVTAGIAQRTADGVAREHRRRHLPVDERDAA